MDEVVLQDVQTADHLGEDQDFVSPCQQFGQQLVNQHQFPCSLDHGLQLEVQRIWTVALFKAFQNLLLSSYKEGTETCRGEKTCFTVPYVTPHVSAQVLTCDEIRMVAALAKLHHSVDEVGHVVLVCSFGQEGEVLLQNGSVVFFLDVGQLHLSSHTNKTKTCQGGLLGCCQIMNILVRMSSDSVILTTFTFKREKNAKNIVFRVLLCTFSPL